MLCRRNTRTGSRTVNSIQPTPVERLANRILAVLLRFGLAAGYVHMLDVRGRKSGRVYSVPVDLMEWHDRKYLVAPRGNTQWVRNVRAAGEITLRRGSSSRRFSFTELDDSAKAPYLKEYLKRYRGAVQRFFTLTPDDSEAAFSGIAARYPVFELHED